MTPPRLAFMAVTLVLGPTAAGWPQSQPGAGEPIESWMERITPGGGDIGVLSDSLRLAPLEFAFPVGFGAIYKVRGREDLFVRQNGAVYGVFPRSEYVQTKDGVVAVWPAGTAFFIGPPPDEVLGRQGTGASTIRPGELDARAEQGKVGGRTDLRVRADAGPTAAPMLPASGTARQATFEEEDRPCVLPRFMGDEAYRRAVLTALVDSARAEPAAPTAPPDRQP